MSFEVDWRIGVKNLDLRVCPKVSIIRPLVPTHFGLRWSASLAQVPRYRSFFGVYCGIGSRKIGYHWAL
jgi:hypothetical protein